MAESAVYESRWSFGTMTEAAREAPTLPAPPPEDLPRQCKVCGSVVLESEIAWRTWPDLPIESGECPCGNTLSRAIDATAEKRRDDDSDLRDEERGERYRAWAERVA